MVFVYRFSFTRTNPQSYFYIKYIIHIQGGACRLGIINYLKYTLYTIKRFNRNTLNQKMHCLDTPQITEANPCILMTLQYNLWEQAITHKYSYIMKGSYTKWDNRLSIHNGITRGTLGNVLQQSTWLAEICIPNSMHESWQCFSVWQMSLVGGSFPIRSCILHDFQPFYQTLF